MGQIILPSKNLDTTDFKLSLPIGVNLKAHRLVQWLEWATNQPKEIKTRLNWNPKE
jgi:hypothetical protein